MEVAGIRISSRIWIILGTPLLHKTQSAQRASVGRQITGPSIDTPDGAEYNPPVVLGQQIQQAGKVLCTLMSCVGVMIVTGSPLS
jgi:hypothetical protein